jgi:hypothetical protein
MKITRAFLALSALLVFPNIAKAITFAQLALGGGYEATLFMTNKSAFKWDGEIRIYQGNTQKWAYPWSVNGKDWSGNAGFSTSIDPKATKKYILRGDSTTRSGYMMINASGTSSTSDIAVAYFYNFYANGSLRDSVGSPPSAWDSKFMFTAEVTSTVDTGMAWCYGSAYTASPFGIRLTAFDENGNTVTSETFTYDGHAAKFITQYLPKLPKPFTGMILLESQNYINLEILRLEMTADGFQLTSTPPDDYVP